MEPMDTVGHWRKSSYSGSGDGDSCVEIAHGSVRMAIRDSKDPHRAALTFPVPAFASFVEALKKPGARP